MTSSESKLEWILDLGCSFHMSPHRYWFFDFTKGNNGFVLLGDNHEFQVKGLGKVKLCLESGIDLILDNVRFIPKLRRNLISLSALDRLVLL